MKYQVITSKKIDKFIAKHKDLAPQINAKLEQIALDPYSSKLDIKKLQGEDKHYRLRVGKYRILYEIIEEQILVYAYDADNRGGIYK